MYSSNSGVCPGSIYPDGLRMRAMLTDFVCVATRPMNSSIRFGLLPAASMIRGLSTSFAMVHSDFNDSTACGLANFREGASPRLVMKFRDSFLLRSKINSSFTSVTCAATNYET